MMALGWKTVDNCWRSMARGSLDPQNHIHARKTSRCPFYLQYIILGIYRRAS